VNIFENTFFKHKELLAEHFKLNESTNMSSELDSLIEHLKKKKKVLLITTSNRWVGDKQKPKSSILAEYISKELKDCEVIDASKLQIYDCEGNVSKHEKNNCGIKDAALKDKEKNPTGNHRCWCSINNKDDELWKVSKILFESDAIVFFVSTRWGQTNGVYQRLIERLTWLENRHSTLNEDNIIKDKEAGMVLIGQNWNGKTVVDTQKQVLQFFGFKVPDVLSFNWQYTTDSKDESQTGYQKAPAAFEKAFGVKVD
jgi:multimeric flavodoxin WrbA